PVPGQEEGAEPLRALHEARVPAPELSPGARRGSERRSTASLVARGARCPACAFQDPGKRARTHGAAPTRGRVARVPADGGSGNAMSTTAHSRLQELLAAS